MNNSHQAIQLIDEKKHFNPTTLKYFKDCLGDKNVGINYHVISVFGSQSSGKSTLLNKLFDTKFDTMDAQVKRQQTTKGIWLSHSCKLYSSSKRDDKCNDFFVLDVEGSDGAERGEDQDFERKAALFALSVSEVLIVNMWENQVGLYQGNNMGLLKTVFEVNLSLFGKSENRHKVALLFVIRDFTSQTPLDSLEVSLVSELEKMWAQLSKPKGCEDSSFHDFFVPKFIALGHKFFQPDQFDEDVRQMGDLFADENDTFFQKEFHTNLPLDGWSLYAENCWEQIEHNKDLDLPTQQILVARFKTDEIAVAAYEKFIESFNSQINENLEGPELATTFKTLKKNCLESDYDPHACRYAKGIYDERRKELSNQLDIKFKEILNRFVTKLTESLLESFKRQVRDKSSKLPFNKKIEIAKERAIKSFDTSTSVFTELELIPSFSEEISAFENEIQVETSNLQARELDLIVARFNKILSSRLKENLLHILSKPNVNVWDKVMDQFYDILDHTLEKYTNSNGEIDFQTGADSKLNEQTSQTIKKNAWSFLDTTIHNYLKEDTIVDILRNIFAEKFRYGEDGMPRFWKNEAEVDQAYRLAKAETLRILDSLAIVKDKNNVEVIIPESCLYPEKEEDQEESEDDGLYHDHRFSHILNALQKEKIINKFKQYADLTIIEAKRSIINTTERIPLYMYAIVVALGWGKIMTILRNPATIVLSIIILSGVYVIHKLNLWSPLLQFANQATGQASATFKQTIRNLVAEDGYVDKRMPAKSFEMKDVDSKESQKDTYQ